MEADWPDRVKPPELESMASARITASVKGWCAASTYKRFWPGAMTSELSKSYPETKVETWVKAPVVASTEETKIDPPLIWWANFAVGTDAVAEVEACTRPKPAEIVAGPAARPANRPPALMVTMLVAEDVQETWVVTSAVVLSE
jgi:hypothetical protein